MDANERVCKRIRTRRIEVGISQDELARRVGYKDRSMITKIEKCCVDISVNKLYQFADALDVSVEWLLGVGENGV